jgi:hypothetical protein
MSFLSAAFLLALPLVAVPVAIHLYRGRQRDVIMWGAMQFLAAAATKGRRMERLEELLLLAVRFAAVAALVLALARPMIRSSLFGDSAEREVILVLDNSLSMSREVDGQSSADRMKEKATEVVNSLAADDGVQVLLAAGNEWATAEPVVTNSAGKRRIQEIVDAIEPTLGAAELLDCLQASVHLEPPDEMRSRRIVVFTDGQASSWQTEAKAAWQQLAADRDAAEIPISIEVVECGLAAPSVENLSVTEVRATRNLVRPGEEAEVFAEISNVGDSLIGTMRAEWLIGDKVIQESPVGALDAHATTQVSAKLPMEKPGHFVVTCRITESDQVPLDQENQLVIEVAEELPILIVDGGNESDPTVSAHALIAAALGYKDDEPQPWHSTYRPEAIKPAALATHPLTDYRAILINNLPEFDSDTMERLDAYVRAGGGLWVSLGNRTDTTTFNRDWYADGDGLSPSELDSLEVVDDAENVAATVHPPSRDHPATLQLANTTQLDVDEARVRERWKFAANESPDQAQSVSVLLESGNGQPLVVEKFVGQGRILIQSFPLGLEWSNLPLLKAYVVMVHDWLDHVCAPTVGRYNLQPGASIIATAPKDAAGVAATLHSPRGLDIPLSATDDDVAPVFRYAQTRMPGTYYLRFTDASKLVEELPFHVARDARESELQPLADADRTALLVPAGVLIAGTESPNSEQVAASPRREPFWTALLAALVTLLAIELLMSNWLSRRRSGFAISTT